MPKEILTGQEGRLKLQSGVDKLANVVKVTLGAKGSNVIINHGFEQPQITKDGVTVAKSIELVDKIENMGASLVKEVAKKTATIAGDGTSTSVVLAQSIINSGLAVIGAGGVNKMDLKRGIDKAVEAIIAEIRAKSKPVEDNETLHRIATISANGDSELGKLISDAFIKIGKTGRIKVEESLSYETTVDVVDGIQIDRSYISPAFISDSERQKCDLIDPLILVYENKLSSLSETKNLMAYCAQNKKALIIIAEDVEGETLQTMVVNKIRGGWPCCAIKAPSFGENRKNILTDIAIATGATFITIESGIKLKDATPEQIQKYLGGAKSVVVTKENTVIVDGNGDKDSIEKRCIEIENELINVKSVYESDALKDRHAKLKNGVALLKVGGTTETERQEKMDRIDDAICATRAAMEEGFVVGGGVTYLKCGDMVKDLKGANEDENKGIQIVLDAIKEPFKQILLNASLDFKDNYEKVIEGEYGMGMNVKTDVFENLLESGVIDPTKVTRVALENAASIASIFLTTEAVLSEFIETK